MCVCARAPGGGDTRRDANSEAPFLVIIPA